MAETKDTTRATRLTAAMLAPVDYDFALNTYENGPVNLQLASSRADFFAHWAKMRVEFADAMMEALDR